MITAGPAVLVAELLAGFHAQHPDVEITLTEADSDSLLAQVRSGELDLACASLAGRARGHRDAGDPRRGDRGRGRARAPAGARDALALEELAAYPLICLPRGTGVRAILDAAGVRARIAFEASDTGVLAQLALRGLGVAILPEPAAAGLHTLQLGLRGRIALVWRAGGPSSPAARALVTARSSV